tara:strand:+ start:415 stop:1158 length:744 start_codon:yes stop_codon:yes gene_type:complete
MKKINQNFINGTIKTLPKKWTEQDVNLLKKYKNNKLSNKFIADKLNRSETSINIKYKRLKKTNDTYNEKHIKQKYLLNDLFIQKIKPKNILDVYAGNSFYKKNKLCKDVIIIDNDIKTKCDYNLKAEDFLYKFKNKKFDLVDLDPYGSAFECFDYALKIAQKGLIITFGEFGHLRWNRIDFVEHRYNIKTKLDFIPDKFISYIEKRALIYNKELKSEIIGQFKNILRVYFVIKNKKKSISGKKYFKK